MDLTRAAWHRTADRMGAFAGLFGGFLAIYFFHLRDGGNTLLDSEGQDIADPSLIAGLALREALGVISHDALTGAIRLDQSIEVRDGNGNPVHHLSFRDAVTVSG